MALSVWREMNSGMGQGMMRSILDYCDLMHIVDPLRKRLYFDVMLLALPERKERKKAA